MRYIKSIAAVVILIVLDQLTKMLAVTKLKPIPEGKVLIPGVFRFMYLENRGSAFGMLQNKTIFFIVFTIIVCAFIIFFYIRLPETKNLLPLRIDLIVLLSGALGNFIDRTAHTYVVDFLYFELIDFPIFNVADIYVTLSAIFLILLILFVYKDEDFKLSSR